ncbi:MAG TPA: trimethylamine methyltransferase family protein [Acidobacteriota bacterium]
MNDIRQGGRRSSRVRGRHKAAFVQLPRRPLTNPYPPMEILSADQLEAIHEASLQVLEEIGLNFLLPEAREILRRAGAEVEPGGPRVRFDRALVEEAVARAPSLVKTRARTPENDLTFGANHINFGAVGGPPNCSDLDRGRRPGTLADLGNFLRLSQSLNICHLAASGAVEPLDIPPNVRHLEVALAAIRLSDKLRFGYGLGRVRSRDHLEMGRISLGLGWEEFTERPSLYTVINANSPLQYDIPMLEGMIEMARAKQLLVITPFTLAGAMAPVTVPGALVQQNAEALAGIAFAEIVTPGTPVVYGGFTSNVDMKTGAPAFGTPEYAQATLIGAQLARRYRLPFRASNVNASNAPDGQSVYESEMSIWACVLGHTNFVLHGLGWLEGGLSASFEKFILDAEMLQMMAAFLHPPEIDAGSLALEAIRDVGPGGHFFSTPHTLARYERAFYAPLLSDWRNFETWSEDGAVDATQRANRIWKQVLAEYEPPPLDPAIDEELQAFVARRTAEGGATMD